jgi:hypothetical protein
MTLTFETAKRRAAKKAIEFTLDGTTYHFKPPKTTALVLADTTTDQLRAQLNWLEAGLPDDESELIRNRLFDLEDDLEAIDLVRIVNSLLEEMSGRPTGPSPE